MGENTFFGLMFALLIGFVVLVCIGTQEAIDDCDSKGGVLVQTYSGDDVCVKKEVVIK